MNMTKENGNNASSSGKVPTESVTYGLEKGLKKTTETIKEAMDSGVRPVIVLIAGGSASGKSTFAFKLKETFGDDATLISLDDYSKGISYINQEAKKGVKLNFDHPEYVDIALVKSHLIEVINGKNIEKPIYSFISGERESSEVVVPGKVMIFEGLFALREELKGHSHINVFIEASPELRLKRRLARDSVRTRMTSKEIERYFLDIVEPMYKEHVAHTKNNAHIVVSTEDS